jgi:uncharacterized protein YbjT (DUF2867 family)
VQDSGIPWTVVRASWFNQNFSEGAFIDMVTAGAITLPGGKLEEPWIDVDDIAEVVTVSLTEPGHTGEVYEVTGPRLITFADIALELSNATGREIAYIDVPHKSFVEGIAASGAPKDVVWLMDYLFSTVLDGRNAYLAMVWSVPLVDQPRILPTTLARPRPVMPGKRLIRSCAEHDCLYSLRRSK